MKVLYIANILKCILIINTIDMYRNNERNSNKINMKRNKGFIEVV